MRKSFTRLFSIFLLLLGLSFQMAYGIGFDPLKTVPLDGNTNAKPADFATKFVVAFDAVPQITDAGGTAVIYKNGGLFKTFPVTKTSASVLVVGKTLEITHGITTFTAGEVYTVAITDGAITGLGGALGGPVGAPAVGAPFDFTVGDYVAPALLTTAASFTPAKGAVNVPFGPMASLVIPFNEAVNVPVATNNLAVYVYKEDGTIVDIIKVGKVGLTTLTGLGTATVTVPVAATAILSENTNYYVVVDAGAFVDASPNTNAFGGLTNKATWTFSTSDNSAPVISAKSVTAVATTSATLNVTLAEAGKYYYGVYPAASTPTKADVIAKTGAVLAQPANTTPVAGTITVAAANVGINMPSSLAGLVGSTDYKVWVVTENSVGVQLTPPVSLPFTTLDNTAPLSVTRGVLKDAANKSYALYMVFNEQVVGGTGTLDLRKKSDESYVKTIAASSIASTKITTAGDATKYGAAINDWVVIVDLGMTLPSNVEYYAVFPSGYIKDLAGNVFTAGTFINPINKGDWWVTSSDFEAPTVAAVFTTPASLSSPITLTFNETIQKQLSTTADWSEVVALEQNNAAVGFTIAPAGAASTGVITLTPTAPLTSNTAYTLRLRKNAVMDISSNTNKITTEQVFTLTTGDRDPLTVQYGSSVGVTTTTNLVAASTIKIKFNKAIKVTTDGGTTWVAADATNLKALITFKKIAADMAFALAYDAATFTATLTPTVALVSGAADYNFTFDGTKVDDAALVAPVALAASGTIVYTVKDYLAPTVTLSKSGNVSSTANPTITFNEDVRLLAGVATIADGTDVTNLITFKDGSSSGANLAVTSAIYSAKVITIVPGAALTLGKTYYSGIGASVKDATGNVAPATFGSFTIVAPVNPPAIVATTYTVNGSTQTPVATKLVNIEPASSKVLVTVTFNDNIKEVQSVAPFNAVSLTDGVTVWTANVTPTSVSGNTLTVEFTTTPALAATIAAGNVCTLTLPNGIVQASTAVDGVYAQFAGTSILFDSKDITAPVVTAANTYDATPALSTTAVALNTKLELNIGEKVVLGLGDILIKEGTTLIQTIPVNSSNVTLNAAGTLATVVKANLIKYNTVYSVVVPAGAFKDDVSLNSNPTVTFTFTTLPNPQPVVIAAGYSPADNSDLLPTSGPLTLGLTFSEEVIKYDPLVGSRKQWFLIREVGATRASFSGTFDLVAGTDVVVANNYIETASVAISGANVNIATGFTPVAGEKYYVLITPGSFLDKSTGTTLGGDVVPGVFTGITVPTTWNFTTKDENSGTATFAYTKRADGLVAKTSDITISFTRPIKKAGGAAITDADIATLFTLTKTAGTGTLGVKAFVGTISADKKTVTILNSSLVTLGELTESATYTIGVSAGSPMIYANADISTNSVVAFDTFTTSDYTAPAVTATIATPISDIAYVSLTAGAPKQHVATVTFTCSDNKNLASVYYTIQEGDATTAAPAASVVKADKMALVTGTAPAAITYQFTSLKEETSYVVWAVAVDKAGNESAVSRIEFITDDVTKPVIATLPTSFNADKTLTFIFNEAVTGAANSVRILDAATMTELATLNLVADPSATPNPKLLVTSPFAGVATGNTLVNYFVEIDKGFVNDVPVVATDATNTFDGLFRETLRVTSTDAVAPTLNTITFIKSATDPSKYSAKLVFSEPVTKVTTLLPNAVYLTDVTNGHQPFEVVDPINIVTNGTTDVMVNFASNLKSLNTYGFNLVAPTFEDLAGNDCLSTIGDLHFATTDFVAPAVVFAPAKAATAVNEVTTTTLTMTFAEAIRNLDDSALDSYDLDSLVYFKKGTTPLAFTAALAGNVITITPAAALVKDAMYTYGFKAKFEDGANNLIAADAATFSTRTTSPAALYLSWTPAKAVAPAISTWLGATSPVTLNFSGPIFTWSATPELSNLPVTAAKAAAAITVTKNGVAIPVADLVFTVNNTTNTISVAPKTGTDWGSQSEIVVTLLANTIQVNEGNLIAIATDASTYNAEDTVDPTVLTYYPVKVGLTGVSPSIGKTEALELTFSEDVKVGTGTVEIYRWDGVLAKPAMTVTVAADKRTVTLGDLTGLPTNQEYYAIVNPGAVVDVTDNNTYAGLTAVKTWKFMLMDDAIPVVTSYLPVTTNVSTSTKLTITFDRPIVVGAGYVALYKSAAGGDAVQLWRGADNGSTSAFTVSGSVATVNISTLEPNMKYFVELAEGTFKGATSSENQAAISRSVWSFSTEVNAAPLAVTYSPDKVDPMVADVPQTSALTITFDQDVVAGTGNIQLHKKQSFGGPIITNFDVADATKVKFDGTTLTIAADVLKLENNSEYYVIVPGTAVKNTSLTPEYFAGVTVPLAWQFKTFNDVTAPTAVYSPITTGLKPADVKLTMTFNESVVASTGNVVIYNAADDAVVETVALTPAMLVGKVVTVVPTKVVEGMSYYVNVTAGAVKDLAGVNFAGVTNKTDWKFATGDFTAPKLVTWTPNATTLTTEKNHPTLVMTFDENVILGAGKVNIIKKGNTVPAVIIPVTAAMVNGKVVTVTYSVVAPATGLDKNTDYYVTVDAGVVKDLSVNANPSVAVSDVTAWTFKTGDGFVTGLDPDKDNSQFKVYPNPFVDCVTVDNASELSKVVVSNIAGQTVKEVVNPTDIIQLNELRSGVYFISLYQGNAVIKTAKIVKR